MVKNLIDEIKVKISSQNIKNSQRDEIFQIADQYYHSFISMKEVIDDLDKELRKLNSIQKELQSNLSNTYLLITKKVVGSKRF